LFTSVDRHPFAPTILQIYSQVGSLFLETLLDGSEFLVGQRLFLPPGFLLPSPCVIYFPTSCQPLPPIHRELPADADTIRLIISKQSRSCLNIRLVGKEQHIIIIIISLQVIAEEDHPLLRPCGYPAPQIVFIESKAPTATAAKTLP
jgi:hypothetical protein